jgi:hypothetical protein
MNEETRTKLKEANLEVKINYLNGKKETIQSLDILRSKKSITKKEVRSFSFCCLFSCERLVKETKFKHIQYISYNFYGQLSAQNVLTISWSKGETKKDE